MFPDIVNRAMDISGIGPDDSDDSNEDTQHAHTTRNCTNGQDEPVAGPSSRPDTIYVRDVGTQTPPRG